jgi:hypothetical protein
MNQPENRVVARREERGGAVTARMKLLISKLGSLVGHFNPNPAIIRPR